MQIGQLDFHIYHHEIDHIMDNFSLTNGMPKIGNKYQISNPNRTNTGGRLEYQKKFDLSKIYFGGNYNLDKHKSRAIANQNSTQEAERQLGFNHSNISKCCNKKYGSKTVGGLHFEWAE